jgi:hypothetical protein
MNVDILYEDFTPSVQVLEKKHIKYQGIVGGLGPTMPEQPLKKLFATLSFSPKESITLNKGVKRKWGDYTVKEQLIIISRYTHFLDTISTDYQVHYEYTRDMNLHIHCIIDTRENEKDLRIKSKRFFSIKAENRGFIDVRPITDLDALILYLTNKTEKKYQTTGISPIIKKSIE